MAIGTAYIKIMPEAKGISSAIGGAVDPAAAAAGKSGGLKLAGMLKKAIAAAGIGAALTKTLMAGADLEQNLGGTEAVFGKHADALQAKAASAYKNMGMSASDFMATSNKMGALFQGSGLSQQKSLKLTETAMQRAADVASVMGIDTQTAMESIAGAAKGNFTMMDNLGVAMNATTLQAYALEKGVNFDWNTASNAEKAELAMRMFMDRTKQYEGNFEKESRETLAGSFGMLKASFQDFLGNLTLGNDITPQIQAIAHSALAVFKNFAPAIVNIITGIPKAIIANWPAIVAAVQTGVPKIAAYIQSNWPKWVQLVFSTMQKIGTAIIENLPTLISKAQQIAAAIYAWLGQNFPGLVSRVLQLAGNLGLALMKRLPSILAALGRLLVTLVKGVVTLAWNTAKAVFSTILSGIGTLASGIVGKLKSGLASVVSVITSPFTKAKETLDGIVQKIKGLFPLRIGNIFSGFKLPRFNISGGRAPWGIGGAGEKPSFSVDWYRKAENTPYMFRDATLFGAGEHNDEILYGRRQLMRDIAQAAGGGEINIYVNGGNADAASIAQEVERRLIAAQKRRRLAWQ